MKDLPSGWEWKKLGQITECLDSRRIPVTKNQREKGDVPYYGANGIQGYVKEFIFEEELLLLAEDGGSWGRSQKCAYIIRGKSWVNNHAHVLRMKPVLLIKFLEAFLNLEDLTKYISGTTRGKLNQKQMNDIEIPVPPLPVQKRIVAILERAEKLKEKRQRANDDTNTIIQSLFYEMFGDPQTNAKDWQTTTLLEVSAEKPQYGSGAKAVDYDNKIRYIRITDVNESGNLREDSVASPSEFEEKYLLKGGDLLFARSGATVGKTYLHQEEKDNSIYAGYMIRFRFKTNICNPAFIFALTKTKYYQKWLLGNQTQVAQPNINAQQYGGLKIFLPPISLQNQFASLVEKIESLKQKQSNSTSDINNLFDALMQKAFNGGLAL